MRLYQGECVCVCVCVWMGNVTVFEKHLFQGMWQTLKNTCFSECDWVWRMLQGVWPILKNTCFRDYDWVWNTCFREWDCVWGTLVSGNVTVWGTLVSGNVTVIEEHLFQGMWLCLRNTCFREYEWVWNTWFRECDWVWGTLVSESMNEFGALGSGSGTDFKEHFINCLRRCDLEDNLFQGVWVGDRTVRCAAWMGPRRAAPVGSADRAVRWTLTPLKLTSCPMLRKRKTLLEQR